MYELLKARLTLSRINRSDELMKRCVIVATYPNAFMFAREYEFCQHPL
jgi:hypothetical protein